MVFISPLMMPNSSSNTFANGARQVVVQDAFAVRKDLDRLAVQGDQVLTGSKVARQVAENGVVLEQMRQGAGRGEIVDSDKFEIGFTKRSAKNVAADAAEAVD